MENGGTHPYLVLSLIAILFASSMLPVFAQGSEACVDSVEPIISVESSYDGSMAPGSGPSETVNYSRGWWGTENYIEYLPSTKIPSLALDSDDNPLFCYEDDIYGLVLKGWNGTAWVNTRLSYTAYRTAMKIDENDNVHIAYVSKYYTDNGRGPVYYRFWNGTTWSSSTVHYGYPMVELSLDVDSKGIPHVSYRSYYSPDLYYSYWNGTGWQESVVDSYGDVGHFNQIRLDSNDHPHIVYMNKTSRPFKLKMASWNGTSWSISDIFTSNGVEYPVHSFELDSNDVPHVAFRGNGYRSIKYLTRNSSGWFEFTLDGGGGSYSNPSLKVNKEGDRLISYINRSGRIGRFIVLTGGPGDLSIKTNRTSIQNNYDLNVDMQLDSHGIPMMIHHTSYISFSRLNMEFLSISNPEKKEVWKQGNTVGINWTSSGFRQDESVRIDLFLHEDLPGAKLEKISEIVGGVLASDGHYNWTIPFSIPYHFRYKVRIQSELSHIAEWYSDFFTILPNKNWGSAIVHKDYYRDIGFVSSIAIASNGTPHIAYGYYRDLYHMYFNGTDWNRSQVDSGGDFSGSIELVLDENDRPHIVYQNRTENDLKYAHWNGTSWNISTIDSSGDLWGPYRIVYNNTGALHVCYLRRNSYLNSTIVMSVWNGRQFAVQDIITITESWSYIGYDVDENDQIHLSYMIHEDYSENQIYYGRYNGSVWNFSSVWGLTGERNRPKLVVNSTGVPYILMFMKTPHTSTPGTFKLLHWNGSSWVDENMPVIDSSQNINAMICDGQDRIHVSYYYTEDSWPYDKKIGYNLWNGSGWRSFGFDKYWYGDSMALDSNDLPHVSYYEEDDDGRGYLNYALLTGFPTNSSAPLALSAERQGPDVVLSWDPPANNGGYQIDTYMIFRGNSTGNITWIANVTGSTHRYLDDDFENRQTNHYYLKAVNQQGTSNRSDIISYSAAIQVILIDDDGGNGYEADFGSSLEASGIEYYPWDINERGPPDLEVLSTYDVAIWTLANQAANTLSTSDQTLLMDYLDGGGRLYMSGMDLLYDLNGGVTGTVTNTFVNDYLGVASYTEDTYTSVIGINGDVISEPFGSTGLSYPFTNLGDELGVTSDGIQIFKDPSDFNIVAVRVDNNTFRTVFTGFPFEALWRSNSSSGDLFLKRTIEWMLGDPGTPSPPVNISSRSTTSFVDLTWEPPIDSGTQPLIGYSLYRRISTGTDFTHLANTTATSYNDTTVASNGVYYYYVIAYNSVGGSLASRIVRSDEERPRFGTDSTPNGATTGETHQFSIQVTDNTILDGVYVEYWFGTGEHLNGSLSGSGTYTLTISVPTDSTDALHYLFRAVDHAGTWENSSIIDVTVSDNDAPTFGTDTTPAGCTTGEPFTFGVSASDNIELSKVEVEYWYGAGGHTITSMKGPGPFSLAITVPTDSTQTLHYFFNASDEAGNHIKTAQKDVVVSDNDLPSFISDDTSTSGTTGDALLFNVSIVDNVGVGSIWVEYRYGTGTASNISMSGTGPYKLEVTIPSGSLDSLFYLFHASDLSENWIETSTREVTILDNDRPWFGADVTPTLGTTGDEVVLSIEVTDNIELGNVHAEYWFGSGARHNETMSGSGTYTIDVGALYYSTDALSYIFHAVDSSGNWNETERKNVTIHDNDLPMIILDSTPTSSATGDQLIFNAQVTDNIAVMNVSVKYWYAGMLPVQTNMTGSGTYLLPIVIPWDSLLDLNYRFYMWDSSGNVNVTGIKVIPIYDNDKPIFGPDQSDQIATSGDLFRFDITAVENIGMDSIWLEYWFNMEPHNELDLSGNGRYSADVTMPDSTFGNMSYLFHARDTSENYAITVKVVVDLVDNDRPLLWDETHPEGNVGSSHTFLVHLWDNDPNKGDAYVEYWFGEGSHENATMDEITGRAPHAGVWAYTVALPSDSIDPLHYFFSAVDDHGNWNRTLRSMVTVLDNIPPELISDLSDETATTGDELTFTIEVRDNIEVSGVWVECWWGVDSSKNVSLELALGMRWELEMAAPEDFSGQLEYRFHFHDSSYNWVATNTTALSVVDNDIPWFGDVNMSNATTGKEMTVTFTVFDNVGLTEVALEYWFDEGDTQTRSVDFNGLTYSTVILIDEGAGEVHFRITALDGDGNSNRTGIYDVMVYDDIPPLLEEVSLPTIVGTGETYTVYVNVSDNIEIEGVYLLLDDMRYGMINDDGSYTYDLRAPDGFQGYDLYLGLSVEIVDLSGHSISEDIGMIEVVDVITPILGDLNDITLKIDQLAYIEVVVMDNNDMYILEWSEDNLDMVDGRLVGSFDTPGTYPVTLTVIDIGGNSDSLNFTITVEEGAFDTDGDGMSDIFEDEHGLNKTDSSDGTGDPDDDGLTNLQEYTIGTNPTLKDTDQDGMSDGWEVSNDLDPLTDSAGDDPDDDGQTNLQEFANGNDPNTADGVKEAGEEAGFNPLWIVVVLLVMLIIIGILLLVRGKKSEGSDGDVAEENEVTGDEDEETLEEFEEMKLPEPDDEIREIEERIEELEAMEDLEGPPSDQGHH